MSTGITILPILIIIIPIIVIIAISFIWKNTPKAATRMATKTETVVFVLLSFFIPLVGVILFFLWKDTKQELVWPITYGLKAYLVVLIIFFLWMIFLVLTTGTGLAN